jgi:hypothetical protein
MTAMEGEGRAPKPTGKLTSGPDLVADERPSSGMRSSFVSIDLEDV